MALSIVILGPPQILETTTSAAVPTKPAHPINGSLFMNLLTAQFNEKAITHHQPAAMGWTENLSATFLTTGNPCLDFFFHVVPNTPPTRLTDLLGSAWTHNPLTTTKLVYHLRGVRGKGKSDKEGFYAAALWLQKHHPKTLAHNVRYFAEAGYLKDLPEILLRLLEGLETRKIEKQERIEKSFKSRINRRVRRKQKKLLINRPTTPREERLAAEAERIKQVKEKAAVMRNEKTLNLARRVLDRYNNDEDFRFLYDEISKLFAELLSKDLEAIKKEKKAPHLSLAAKWCPSLDSSYDRSLLLCESVAKHLFPRKSDPEYAGLDERYYTYRVRDRLRTQVLVPLRKLLQLPEVYMSANHWDILPYNRVASVAMKNYKKIFQKHDPVRFQAYLEDVNQGKAKIASGALLPHEIVQDVVNEASNEVAELQWKSMVDELKKKKSLTNCLAVCDVSGSMQGTPMEVCIAMGLLVSELSEEPWRGHVITFSEHPQLHKITGETLKEKHEFVHSMDWGMNTNFQKVFDLLLRVAVEAKLEEKDMIKRVIVFSDMEFDQASARPWETDYMVIERKFKERGYQKPPGT